MRHLSVCSAPYKGLRNGHHGGYTPCVVTCREGIDLVLNSRVASVSRNMVSVVDAKKNETSDIPFGACVWATGVAMHRLVKQLQVQYNHS